jgi:hypothetical protein
MEALMPAPVLSVEDVSLLESARRWRPEVTIHGLDVKSLGALAATDGLELATGVAYDRICDSSKHGQLIRAIHACTRKQCKDLSPMLCVVPGLLWEQNKHTGADGTMVMRVAVELGLKAERVDLPGLDSVGANAQRILEWLRRHRSGPVVLVSLSKGSWDVLAALALSQAGGTQEADFGHVRSWLSLSGTIQGNQLVQWLCDRPLRAAGVRLLLRLRGYKFDHIKEFERKGATEEMGWPKLPGGMRLIHAIGFPLRRHLTHRWAPKAYMRLESLGPNDGCGVLLGDVTGWPGEVFPVWGSDHYLQPAWDIHPVMRSLVLAAVDGWGVTG